MVIILFHQLRFIIPTTSITTSTSTTTTSLNIHAHEIFNTHTHTLSLSSRLIYRIFQKTKPPFFMRCLNIYSKRSNFQTFPPTNSLFFSFSSCSSCFFIYLFLVFGFVMVELPVPYIPSILLHFRCHWVFQYIVFLSRLSAVIAIIIHCNNPVVVGVI